MRTCHPLKEYVDCPCTPIMSMVHLRNIAANYQETSNGLIKLIDCLLIGRPDIPQITPLSPSLLSFRIILMYLPPSSPSIFYSMIFFLLFMQPAPKKNHRQQDSLRAS